MPDFLHDITTLDPGDEYVWPGGGGSLLAYGASTLRIRRPGSSTWIDSTDAKIEAADGSGVVNFSLGKGLIITVSAEATIAPGASENQLKY